MADIEQRARFEAWAAAQSFRASNIDTARDSVVPEWYVSDVAAITWCAWQAALASQAVPILPPKYAEAVREAYTLSCLSDEHNALLRELLGIEVEAGAPGSLWKPGAWA